MTSPYDNNRYKAIILKHVDADTTHVEVSLGLDVRTRITVRWAGIDAPERNTELGKKATMLVNEWLPVGSLCEIETTKLKKEKFGRYLASFYIEADAESLNDKMIRLGIAVPYTGGPR